MHFLHTLHHFNQRGVELTIAADGADDRLERSRRAMHVEAHLDELRDHLLHLRVFRTFLHYDNH